MRKKIGLFLILTAGLYVNAFAAVHPLTTLSIDYQLKPNIPEVFSNIFFWTIKAQCTISNEATQVPLNVTMKKRGATVNGQILSEGSTAEMTVNAGDKILITAEKGAQVEITNLGASEVIATCSTV